MLRASPEVRALRSGIFYDIPIWPNNQVQWSPSYAATHGELKMWPHIRGVTAGEGESLWDQSESPLLSRYNDIT